jgi:serine protease inhibitor
MDRVSRTLVGLLAAGCAFVAVLGVSGAAADHPADYVDFGVRIFDALTAAKPDSNVVVSPASAAFALSMAYDGAAGETATQMAAALGSGTTPDEVDAANERLVSSLLDQHDVTLEMANSVWFDAIRRDPLPSFVSRVERAYRARAASLDFDDPDAAGTINDFVSSATHGKIAKIVDAIPASTVMYLVNATYFKGTWASKFDPTQTQPKPFALPGGATATVPRMSKSADFAYFETPDLQAVRLPYVGGRFAMEIVLPRKTTSLTDVERSLSADQWRGWQSDFATRNGTLELPRFTLEWSSHLVDALEALGITRAFDASRAAFPAMFAPRPGNNVYISDVLQKTYLKVDEEGSEAAAVTQVTMTQALAVAPRAAPFTMIVDHPFFCAIVDGQTGVPLFLAAVDDPAATE